MGIIDDLDESFRRHGEVREGVECVRVMRSS